MLARGPSDLQPNDHHHRFIISTTTTAAAVVMNIIIISIIVTNNSNMLTGKKWKKPDNQTVASSRMCVRVCVCARVYVLLFP